jgi:hypothetical protein
MTSSSRSKRVKAERLPNGRMLNLMQVPFVGTSTERSPMFGSSELVVEAAAERLVAMFDLQDCWFESFPFDAQLPRIEPGRIVLPAAEPGVAPWSFGLGVELPVRFRGLTLGRFVLVPTTPTTGVVFPPGLRTEAIAMAIDVATAVAASLLNETAGGRARG